jgi:hypothetical protein
MDLLIEICALGNVAVCLVSFSFKIFCNYIKMGCVMREGWGGTCINAMC